MPKNELLERLAQGHAAGVTVLTPNRRLAQALTLELDDLQIARGLRVWEAPDILPFSAYVERLYEDALYSELAAALPLLLTPAQEQALWETAIRESRWGEALLAVPQAAADCRRAWALAHRWRIASALAGVPGNDDAKAFVEWSRDYARRCEREGHTDGARLPDVVARLLPESALRKPRLLVAYAFDVLSPQEQALLDACPGADVEVRGCAPALREAKASRRVFLSAREELEAAANWARAKLAAAPAESGAGASTEAAAPRVRIGVVVPELELRRREVLRVFSRVLHPGFNLPGAKRRPLPFNVSLGAPLDDYPLARAALSILELAAGEVPFEQASRLVRSPFIAAAAAELAQRALLDAALRQRAPARLTLGKLVGLAEGCPVLRRRLEALFALVREAPAGERSPHDWGRHFSAVLEAVGFPGERALDSAEFQTRAKFNETLAEFAKLGRVAPRMGAAQALAQLRRLCAETLFQPESPDTPIQVLGVFESEALEFDALWVSGLSDEAWPLHPKPNAFLPPALQKKAGIAEASPEASLARAKRITEGWLGAAPEVIVSHPAHEQDRALIASPLIAALPVTSSEAAEDQRHAKYRDLVFAARRLEAVPDGSAPALATRTPRGGTRILADQAACPFRAFARHRLAAEALEEPAEGPDARARGLALHALMSALWKELKDSRALEEDCTAAIARAAAAALAQAELEEPFAALERKRLARLAREWLEVERARPAFRVVAMEQQRKLAVAGLQLNGRIDRMDELEGGRHALIDYKSGRSSPIEWLGERPEDPQLPLYALNAGENIAVVAFARVQAGEMKYMGFAEQKDLIPNVKPAKDWNALLERWKKELDALGAGFAAGDARVDPKKLLATCRSCDLQPLCRVYERIDVLGAESEEEGDG